MLINHPAEPSARTDCSGWKTTNSGLIRKAKPNESWASSTQEGNDAEAARPAVAQGLKVRLFIDDNDASIAGHPSEYMKGLEVGKTLEGHGLKVLAVDGGDIDAVWGAVSETVLYDGPPAVISKRKMAPVRAALGDFENRPYEGIPKILNNKPMPSHYLFVGSKDFVANCAQFGEAVNAVLDKIGKEEARKHIMIIDSTCLSAFSTQ
ncbi:hypothetical protein PQX77_008165 [Marasmius sp. AFHP31]|nr:hypothetical protein PQX77_008165 [Marasmius sp. AFHP31]